MFTSKQIKKFDGYLAMNKKMEDNIFLTMSTKHAGELRLLKNIKQTGNFQFKINDLNINVNLNDIQRFSSYRTVSTLRLDYKHQPINAVQGKNRCQF